MNLYFLWEDTEDGRFALIPVNLARDNGIVVWKIRHHYIVWYSSIKDLKMYNGTHQPLIIRAIKAPYLHSDLCGHNYILYDDDDFCNIKLFGELYA